MSTESDITLKSARLIKSILVMTRIKNKDHLIDATKMMCDVAEKSDNYSIEDRKIYKLVYKFFKVIWEDDLEDILNIVFGK